MKKLILFNTKDKKELLEQLKVASDLFSKDIIYNVMREYDARLTNQIWLSHKDLVQYFVLKDNNTVITSWSLISKLEEVIEDYKHHYECIIFTDYLEAIELNKKLSTPVTEEFKCDMCWSIHIKPEQIVCDNCEHLLNWLPNLKPNI